MAKNGNNKLSQAAFIRSVLLRSPDITLEQLQAEHDKAGRSAEDRPDSKHDIYRQRGILQDRWGKLSKLPRMKSGRLNVAALLRAYLAKHGKVGHAEAAEFFAMDGLSFPQGAYYKALAPKTKKVGRKARKTRKGHDSPDPNQHSGPRARRLSKIGRPAGSRKRKSEAYEVLLIAKRAAADLGGIEPAITALQMLGKLQE